MHRRKELKNYTVATVTNQDEHDFLDSYLDKRSLVPELFLLFWWKGKKMEMELMSPPRILLTVHQVCMKMLWLQRELRMQIL